MFETMVPDSVFDELLTGVESEDMDTAEYYPHENDMPDIEMYGGDASPSWVKIAEQINQDMNGMTEAEAEEYFAEIWPAIIGAVGSLIPVAARAISNAVSSRRRSRTPRPTTQRPTPQRPSSPGRTSATPPPAPAPATPPAPATGSQTVSSQPGQQALSALVQLLQNPAILNSLTRLVSGGGSSPTTVGSTGTTVREGAILNAISEYARLAKMEIPDNADEDALNYLIDDSGEWISGISSEEARARRFMEVALN